VEDQLNKERLGRRKRERTITCSTLGISNHQHEVQNGAHDAHTEHKNYRTLGHVQYYKFHA
jgi:hypothetical protein